MQELEAVREREPEANVVESSLAWMARLRLRVSNGRVVLRGKDTPYTSSYQGRYKLFLGPHAPDTCLPDWRVFLHHVSTTREGVTTSGLHRHQGGIGLFVIDGEGHTVVDGVRHNWKEGDIIMLPMKPGGLAHQHFAKPGTTASWIAFLYDPQQLVTGSWMEQLAVGSLATSDPQWPRLVQELEAVDQGVERVQQLKPASLKKQPTGLYGDLLRLRDAERERLSKAKVVTEWDKAPTETTPMGIVHWYVHPSLEDAALRTYLLWVQEIPAGSRSGRMLQQGGRLHYVWKGRGYTVVDGVTHDWEQGDVICLPTRPLGIVFQHFNTGDEPVRLVTIELNWISSMGVDLGTRFEVLEPAPEYRD